jgi:hypothetical protein
MNPKFYWTILVAIFVGGVVGGQIPNSVPAPAGEQLLTSTITAPD